MVRLVLLGFAATFLLVQASPAAKRTVAQIQADLATVNTAVTNLNNSISTFPDSGGSVAGALTIHNNAITLENDLTNTTSDVTATGPIGVADANGIIATLQPIVPKILAALKAVVAKKQAFQNLPLGGVPALVKQDLTDLQTKTKQLENALIANEPANAAIQSQAAALTSTVDAAFATAVAAYANV